MNNVYQTQRGVTLFVVIVMVLLSTLFALWASKTSLFNEILISNDADYQRAFEAAQAALQDAELDIRGIRPDGGDCTPDATKPNVCRAGSAVYFVDEQKDLVGLFSSLEIEATRCKQGICLKRTGNQDFWTDPTALNAMLVDGVGARYGQYTGALTGSASNPILNQTAAGRGAWYWVEVMPYDTSPGLVSGQPKLELNLTPQVVYRITTIARGLKASTQVVLQSTFARQKLKD